MVPSAPSSFANSHTPCGSSAMPAACNISPCSVRCLSVAIQRVLFSRISTRSLISARSAALVRRPSAAKGEAPSAGFSAISTVTRSGCRTRSGYRTVNIRSSNTAPYSGSAARHTPPNCTRSSRSPVRRFSSAPSISICRPGLACLSKYARAQAARSGASPAFRRSALLTIPHRACAAVSSYVSYTGSVSPSSTARYSRVHRPLSSSVIRQLSAFRLRRNSVATASLFRKKRSVQGKSLQSKSKQYPSSRLARSVRHCRALSKRFSAAYAPSSCTSPSRQHTSPCCAASIRSSACRTEPSKGSSPVTAASPSAQSA